MRFRSWRRRRAVGAASEQSEFNEVVEGGKAKLRYEFRVVWPIGLGVRASGKFRILKVLGSKNRSWRSVGGTYEDAI